MKSESWISTESLLSHTQMPCQQKQEIVEASRDKLTYNNGFPCPLCLETKQSGCAVCKGKGTFDNSSSFSKFVDAIVDFKMGRSKAVLEEMLHKSRKKDAKESAITSVSVAEISEGKEFQDFWSGSCKDRFTIKYKSSLKQSTRVVVHEGIQCDQCHQIPIVGIRHKCKQCQDYDLCAKCHESHKHQHKTFYTVLQSKRDHQKQRLRGSVHAEAASDCLKLGSMLTRVHDFFK